MSDPRLVEFCGEVRKETVAAYLVFDGRDETWIPKSQVKEMRSVGRRAGDYEFIIPEWLAIKKEII